MAASRADARTRSSLPGCASAARNSGALADIDWKSWDPTKADQAEVDAIEAPVARFLSGISKREFLD